MLLKFLLYDHNCLITWATGMIQFKHTTTDYLSGGRYLSVDSSAPTILRSRDWIPSTPYMLLHSQILHYTFLSLYWEKDENNEKEAGFGPYSLNNKHSSQKLAQSAKLGAGSEIIRSLGAQSELRIYKQTSSHQERIYFTSARWELLFNTIS